MKLLQFLESMGRKLKKYLNDFSALFHDFLWNRLAENAWLLGKSRVDVVDEIVDGFATTRFGRHENNDLFVLVGLAITEIEDNVAIWQRGCCWRQKEIDGSECGVGR